MDPHFTNIVQECTAASDSGRLRFPDIIARLIDAGVERYTADLCMAEKIYYRPDGTTVRVPCQPLTTPIAELFNGAGVEAAVRAAQAGDIDYKIFCAKIAAAGCVGYIVSLAGRRVAYYGRTAEMHVEYFPGSR